MTESTNATGRLAGARALVTGAGGHGIGAAIALAFAREGASVLVVDVDEAQARTTHAAIIGDGGLAATFRGDVGSEDDCRAAVAAAVEAWGGLDIVVNNVGVSGGGATAPIHAVDLDDWDRAMRINLGGALLVTKHAIGPLLASERAAIVNISSVAGLHALGTPGYSAAKAALVSLTRDTAFLYGRNGIRANAIAVGHVANVMAGGRSMDDDYRERRRRIGLLAVEGTPDDVAAAAVFLGSTDARFITGHCLVVDGGATAIAPLMATTPLLLGDVRGDELPALADVGIRHRS